MRRPILPCPALCFPSALAVRSPCSVLRSEAPSPSCAASLAILQIRTAAATKIAVVLVLVLIADFDERVVAVSSCSTGTAQNLDAIAILANSF